MRRLNLAYFPSNIWVRQGDNLSPLIFDLFINDFKQNMTNTYRGLKRADFCYHSLNDNIILLIKLFVFGYYADDTIVFAENNLRNRLPTAWCTES